MAIVSSVLQALLSLQLGILLHELAHFGAFVLSGVRVEEFWFGLSFRGRALFSFHVGGYPIKVGSLPFGAGVAPHEDDLWRASLLKKIFIFLSGPAMNLLCVFLVLLGLSVYFQGVRTTVQKVPDLVAGVLELIVKVPALIAKSDQPLLSGPVGFLQEGSKIIRENPIPQIPGFIILFLGTSLSLGILNLIPIPALDGGQALMAILYELDLISRRTSNALRIATFLILLALGILIMILDIKRLIGF